MFKKASNKTALELGPYIKMCLVGIQLAQPDMFMISNN